MYSYPIKYKINFLKVTLIVICISLSCTVVTPALSSDQPVQYNIEDFEDIVDVTQLNDNIAVNDPTVELPSTFDNATKTGSRLSPETANDYIFESHL